MARGSSLLTALVVFGACYDPHPPIGARCDEMHPCPSGQACIGGTCDGAIDAAVPGDGPLPPDASGPNDLDGDGIANMADNCPNAANANQGNEDGDPLGDACDPCPIDAASPPSDPDSDGVSDSCDPRPSMGGDTIALFEGFHAGVPASWQVVGNAMQMGDDAVMVGVGNNRGALVPPIVAPTNGVITAKATIANILGNTDAALAVVLPYDPARDDGIFCELYAPNSGSSSGRRLDIWDSMAQLERGSTAYSWQVSTAYTMSLRRTGTSYGCTSTPGNQVNGSSNESTQATNKVAVFTYSVTAHVAWVMVVTSP